MEMLRESRAREKVDGVDQKACIVDRNQFFNTQVTFFERVEPAKHSTTDDDRGWPSGRENDTIQIRCASSWVIPSPSLEPLGRSLDHALS